MKTRLTEKQIRHAIAQCRKDRSTAGIASEPRASRRRIRQLWSEFRMTGRHHVQGRPGRELILPTPEEAQAVQNSYREDPAGAVRTARNVRANCSISYWRAYRVMGEEGVMVHSEARSKRRKWVRYERVYSNAMWHVDWHEMKDPRFRGPKLVTYLDDASRCILGAQVFTEAASGNAVLVLQKAVREFGTTAAILSDNGSCFVGRGGRRKKKDRRAPKSWTPTVFEAELLDRGIELTSSRQYHPQTNGKLERFHRSTEEEIFHYESLSAYVQHYNERRLHFSPDIDSLQTPLRACSDKKATDAIRKSNPEWMEGDINGQAK